MLAVGHWQRSNVQSKKLHFQTVGHSRWDSKYVPRHKYDRWQWQMSENDQITLQPPLLPDLLLLSQASGVTASKPAQVCCREIWIHLKKTYWPFVFEIIKIIIKLIRWTVKEEECERMPFLICLGKKVFLLKCNVKCKSALEIALAGYMYLIMPEELPEYSI